MPKPANERRELDPSILDRARRLIADKMGKFSAAMLGAGMATGMAASVLALASPNGLDERALVALISNLGVNWLAQAIWEMRARMASARFDEAAEVRRLADRIAPNMTDARLRRIAQDLDLIKTTLTALKQNQSALDAVAQEANALGLIGKEELLRIAGQINVTFSGDVINSLVVTAGGDVRLSNVTVNIGGATTRVELQEDIRAYKRALAARLGALDLRGFDVAFQQVEQPPQMESVYIPLYARSPQSPVDTGAFAGERARSGPWGAAEDFLAKFFGAAEEAGRSERFRSSPH